MKRLLERLRLRRGVDEELAAYLEEKTADLMEAGIPEAEARLRARREFGSAARIAEDSRAALGFAWFDHLAQDLRYALRTMRRNPAFTAVAALSLALGIGANTAIFGLLDTIVWRMLPVPHPEELWAVSRQEASGKAANSQSYPLYTLWRDHNRSIGALAASGSLLWRDGSLGSNDTQHLGQLVSGNYFDVLGVPALIGRTIAPADDSIEGAGGPQGGGHAQLPLLAQDLPTRRWRAGQGNQRERRVGNRSRGHAAGILRHAGGKHSRHLPAHSASAGADVSGKPAA